MNRRRWKNRASRLHAALYIAAEGAEDLYATPPLDGGPLSEDEATELGDVMRELADALYSGDADGLARLAKQFRATERELDELPPPGAHDA